MRRFWVGLLVAVSAVCLVLSSTSLWVQRHVVDTPGFVAAAENVIAQPAVQARVTTQVVDTVMALPEVQQAIDQGVAILPPRLQTFRPSIEDGVRSVLDRGTTALLASQAFNTVVRAGLTSAHTQLVNGQDVRFDLGQAKALIPPSARTGLAGQVINLIPSTVGVTVLTKAQAPQLYTTIDLLKSAWLWLGLIALALLAGALVLSARRLRTLRAWAVTNGVLGLLIVIALALARGPLLANVKPANVDAADAVYGIVSTSLRDWTLWFTAGALVVVAGTLLWGRVGLFPAIRRSYHSARERAVQHREARALAAAAAAEAGVPAPARDPWPQRVAASTRTFVDGLDLPQRTSSLAAQISAHRRAWRWAGVAVGAVILVFWPGPTLSTVIWVAALVGLYIGLLELVMDIGHPERVKQAQAGAEPATPEVQAATPAEIPAPGGPAEVRSPQDVPAAGLPAAVSTAGPAAAPVPTSAAVTTGTGGATRLAQDGGSEPTVRTAGAPGMAATAEPAATQLATAPAPRTSTETSHEATSTEASTGQTSDTATTRPAVTTVHDLTLLSTRLDLLVRLGEVRKAGLLTDDEFAETKFDVLGRPSQPENG